MPHRKLTAVLALAAAAALTFAGCASSKKKVEELPNNMEATVQVAPSEPDRIEFIDVQPWSAKPGDTVNVSVRGAKDRTVAVSLTGLDGQASGVSKTVNLSQTEPGVYGGSLKIDEKLPPGRYRIESVMTGGPSGQPVRLVSSRALTIEPPPPPPVDPCDEARKALLEPRIYFAYDKSDITDTSAAYLQDVARRLAGLEGRVARVTIEGHADERGTVEYNLALGSRRANAVRNVLAKEAGMAGLTIETVSKGKEQPVIPNATTEEEHAKNRRAFFVVECTPAR